MPRLLSPTYRSRSSPSSSVALGFQPLASSISPPACPLPAHPILFCSVVNAASCPGGRRTKLVNVAASVRVFHEAQGAGGGGSPGCLRGPGDSTLSVTATPLRAGSELFLARRQNCGLLLQSRAVATPERIGLPSFRHGLPAARGAEPAASAASAAQPPSRRLPRAVQLRRDARGLWAPRTDLGLAARCLPSRHHRTGADRQQLDGTAARASGCAPCAARSAPGCQPLALRLPLTAAARLAGRPPRTRALPRPALCRASGAARPLAALRGRGRAASSVRARPALLGGSGGAGRAAGPRAATRAAAGAPTGSPAEAACARARPRLPRVIAHNPAGGRAGRSRCILRKDRRRPANFTGPCWSTLSFTWICLGLCPSPIFQIQARQA